MKSTKLEYNKENFIPGKTHILYDKLDYKRDANLYLVSTPMQLLGAIEAQNHFKTENNILVILFFLIRDGKNINQMFDLIEYFPYDKLITYQNATKYKIFGLINFIKHISKVTYHHVFFGYSTPIYRRIVANLKYKHLNFYDDGVLTVTSHEQIFNPDLDESLPQENKHYKRRLKNLYYSLRGIKVDTDLKDIEFFTIFNLTSYQNEKIISHNFSYIKSIFNKSITITDSVYILGQPLKRAMGMKTIEYIQYLDQVIDAFQDKKIIYIPHRVEPMSDFFQSILYQKSVFVQHIDMPIELYLLKKGEIPQYIISFMTTALFTLKKIFPQCKINYIEIDLAPYSRFHQNNVKNIYKNYINDGIKKFIGTT